MFIGVCGSICAGKRTIARYLVDHHGFTQLSLEIPAGANEASDGIDGVVFPSNSSLLNDPDRPPNPEHIFSAPGDLLEFITKYWRERWVTTDIHTEAVLDLYSRRPFFLLLSVDAPLTVRWQRYQARQQQRLLPTTTTTTTAGDDHDHPAITAAKQQHQQHHQQQRQETFETFVALSDTHLYDPTRGANPLLSRAAVRLLNTSRSLAHLYATLGKLDLLNTDRLRPSWDAYFMSLASLAAQRSNCMKRRVGCVVVLDKRVISTGYNGTPRGLRNCGEGGCARCNAGDGSGHGLATCLCIHAEENALLEAGRERLRDGAVLYCDTCPCLTCSIKIVQVGVGEVVYNQGYSMDGDTAAVFREAGVRLRQFVPPANGLIHLERLE